MDAETRHQLKQNELAEALNRLREFNDPRFLYTIVAVVVVIIAALGWYAWNQTQQMALATEWQQLINLNTALAAEDPAEVQEARSDLKTMIGEASDSRLAGYARLQLARSYYEDALENADQRPDGFNQAAELLREVRASRVEEPNLKAAATFMLASAEESLDNIDTAQQLYQELTDSERFAGSPFRLLARDRLENIDELKEPIELVQGAPPAPPSPAGPMSPMGGPFDLQGAGAEGVQMRRMSEPPPGVQFPRGSTQQPPPAEPTPPDNQKDQQPTGAEPPQNTTGSQPPQPETPASDQPETPPTEPPAEEPQDN